MFNLPPELVLAVLSYLPLDALAALQSVCHSWKTFISEQETAIYHQAAVLHKITPQSSTAVDEARVFYSDHSLAGVTSWKTLCRKRRLIGQSWKGKAASVVTPYEAPGSCVHRLKVEEKGGYVLTTSCEGGLTVTDLATDEILWALPQDQVRPHAHCEYGEGYVMFDYMDGSKEIWRRADEYNEAEARARVPGSLPSTRQLEAAAAAFTPPFPPSTRGHFRPWGLLRAPHTTRAFRFVYPILGAAALDDIYLWDVRTGALIQTIQNTQLGANDANDNDLFHLLGEINYIEVGRRHVFLCGVHAVRGFSRETGRCVLDIPSSTAPFGAWHFGISSTKVQAGHPESALVRQETIANRIHRPQPNTIDEFMAVHVSSCGSHLACLLLSSKLVIIYNFERAEKEKIPLRDLSVEVQLGSPRYSSRYLALEHGRIAVATRTGIFLVQPDFSAGVNLDEPPQMSIFRVPSLGDRSCLGAVSCLQMTDTGLFVNWDPGSVEAQIDSEGLDYLDEIFYSSVEEEPRYANLTNGALVVLVDLNEVDPEPESSAVLRIDFAPLESSV